MFPAKCVGDVVADAALTAVNGFVVSRDWLGDSVDCRIQSRSCPALCQRVFHLADRLCAISCVSCHRWTTVEVDLVDCLSVDLGPHEKRAGHAILPTGVEVSAQNHVGIDGRREIVVSRSEVRQNYQTVDPLSPE
ncbi:MAG: hypothetical protein J07HR59_00664 [Halorubrum sp. J07HR59]|nr:MAG: hypothetical protein J07HR59_00664 [Halorubrum sp. J07HR59]